MKNKNIRSMVITSIICLLPITLSLMLYNDLPESMPTHWDFAGNVNGHMPRDIAIFALPIILLIVNIIVHVAINNNPKKDGIPKILATLTKWFVPMIAIILEPLTTLAAVGADIPMTMIAFVIIGLVFSVTGNYLPKCKQNYVVGIKIPWTLNSEENWNKTHHLAGYLWTIGGIVMIILGFISTKFADFLVPLLILIVVVVTIIPIIYSFTLYKKGI